MTAAMPKWAQVLGRFTDSRTDRQEWQMRMAKT